MVTIKCDACGSTKTKVTSNKLTDFEKPTLQMREWVSFPAVQIVGKKNTWHLETVTCSDCRFSMSRIVLKYKA